MAPLKILNNSLFSYIYIFMCAFLSFFRIKTTNQTMQTMFSFHGDSVKASLTARKTKCKNKEVLQMQSKRKVLKLLGKWLWNVKMRSAENFAFINPTTSYSEDAPPRGGPLWQGALCVYVLLHQYLVIIDMWCTPQKIWTNYVHLQWLSILSISMCEVHDKKFKPNSCTLQTCTAG